MTPIEEFQTNIDSWNNIRNTPNGYGLLRSSPGALIKKEDYNTWLTQLGKPELGEKGEKFTIQVFIGTNGSEIQLYIRPLEGSQEILCAPFVEEKENNGNYSEILPNKEAKARRKAWDDYGREWFDKKAVPREIVTEFRGSSEDFEEIFNAEETTEFFLFFGIMNKDKTNEQQIEIIVCGRKKSDPKDKYIIYEEGRVFSDKIWPHRPKK